MSEHSATSTGVCEAPDSVKTRKMKYEIYATITLEADSRAEALAKAAACVEYWREDCGWDKLSGVGGPSGYVTIKEK